MREFLRAWWVPGVVCAGAVVAAALGEDAYHLYTGEDRICEILQVVFFVLALIAAVRAWRALGVAGRKTDAALYFVAVLGLCFLIGEEVSWGQRIFGWGTPEQFVRANKQDETNLHNLEGAHQAVGWVLLLIGLWGSFLRPLVARFASPTWQRAVDPYIPPARLLPYFLPMLVWRIYRNMFPLPGTYTYAVVQINEVLELVMAIGFWLFFRERARDFAAAGPRKPAAPAK